MENGQSIKDMFFRFNNIVNDLKSLKKLSPNDDLVNKYILLKSKGHCYKRSKRLKNVTTLGFLITHKQILGRDQISKAKKLY